MADWQLIEEGLKRGYSLDEVTDIIAKEEGVDPSYARERGFDSPAILGRLGYVKPEAPKPTRNAFAYANDTAIDVANSATGLLKAGVDLVAPDSSVSESMSGFIKRGEESQSDWKKQSRADLQQKLSEANGEFDKAGIYAKHAVVNDPLGTAAQIAGNAAPFAIAGRAMQGLQAASKVIASVGLSSGLTAGEVRGNIYEKIKNTPDSVLSESSQEYMELRKRMSEDEAKSVVGSSIINNIPELAAAAIVGGLGGKYGFEGMMTGVAPKFGGRIVNGLIGVADEATQGAVEQLASNVGVRRVLPNQSLTEDVGLNAAAEGIMGVGAVVAPVRPSVAPSPSITSAPTADDAIKAFQDEVASVTPRGSFGSMDDLAGLIESERSDLGKRRGLLAQQQQDARDMVAEFSGLVKDEQIDQSYRLNDAQRQRDAERTREGGYDLALQQREEQQGHTVEQLAAASEAQGFGNEEPTAMQLAMQQAQQKALDNEFSGLLKQERASLNEMRANVKRVAGVPVEQISTPQLEEIAQSEAHPNTKMAAVAALNDRHDAIQQERERLMQLRETRLERKSNQPEQGAQHGAESHGTDGQVATPSVAGGGANVSGGGLDAAMVDANGGMRGTASAGAAVSSGGQAGAVPVAEQPANVRALTENAAKRQATQLTNQGYPTVAYPHPTQAGMWAIGSQDEAKAIPQAPNIEAAPPNIPDGNANQNDAPDGRKAIFTKRGDFWNISGEIASDVARALDLAVQKSSDGTKYVGIAKHMVEHAGKALSEAGIDAVFPSDIKQPIPRKKPSPDNIAQAIINMGGVSTSLKNDILGDAATRTRPGFFTSNGTTDLGALASRLSGEFGFSQINLNDATDNSGAKQLADLIARAVNGESILNEEAMIRAQEAEEVARHQDDINRKAEELGIKPSGRGRPFSKVEAEVLKLMEIRLNKEIEEAGINLEEARAIALRDLSEEQLAEIHDKAMDALGENPSILETYRALAAGIKEAVNENERNKKADTERSRSGIEVAGAGHAEEASHPATSGTAREGQSAEAEVTPEFGLVGQTEEEAIAEEQARHDAEAKRQREEQDAENKRQADAERDSFNLSGSTLPADELAARGQEGLFEQKADPIAAVKATLDAAGVTGTDRTTTIAAVRRGDLTPEDVAEAHPAIAENSERVNTEDAGEELRANRRNRSGSLKWSDIKDQEAALRVKEVTKAKVYQKPDYAALAEEIGPVKAHLVKQVYDHIAATPQTGRDVPTDAQLEAYIDAVNSIMDATIAWAKDAVFESQWRMTANGKTLVDTLYPEGWRPQRDVVVLLGGNRHFGGVQPGYKEIKRAEREIAKGWPGKREAWQTQGYKVVETAETAKLQEGRSSGNKVYYIEVGGRYFDSAPSKADGEKMIAEMQPWLLLNKQGRIVSQHQSEEQAVEAARNATKRGGSGGISDKGIAVENAERVGPARRMEGENVTSDQLKETFGFRGVNFGTWMKGKANDGERQLHLNHAYDAFLDLAEIIGVQPKAMSLNGMLGLAIGAQGNGKYAAHFVPGVNEINLTRTSGAGSLAHEFGHALDHYFARLGGLDRQAEPFLTEHTGKPAQGELRPEILDKFDSIVKEMNKRKMTPEEYEAEHLRNVERFKKNIAGWLKAVRHDFEIASINKVTIEDGKAKREKAISKLDALIERIRDKDLGDGRIAIGRYESASPVVMEIRELYKETFGRQMPKNNILGLQSNIDSLVYATSKRDADNSHTPQVSTDYAKNALSLDKDKGGKPYWSTNLEKFARAFDAFVTDTLDAKAAKNSYLSHAGREGATVPAGEERKAINEAFKALVDAIETKETDSGVAMFNAKSGSIGNPIDAAALESTIASVIAASPSQWRRDTVVTATLFSELPAPIVEKAKAEGYDAHGRNRDGQKLTGATYDGKVYLVQENITSEIEAEETLLHERIHQILHGNAEDENGKALRQSLGRLYSRIGGKDAIVALAKRIGADMSGPLAALPKVAVRNRPAFLVDEFLAHVEGQRAYEKFPQSVVRAIREFYGEFRDWLRSSKFVKIADAVGVNIGTFTQSDLSWTLKKIRQQQAGTGSKAIRFMTAWHGSPHDHDGFDSSKIGTGEGAQAYGYGLYFAGSREVAEYYRDALAAEMRNWNYAEAAKSLGIDSFEEFRSEFHAQANSQAPTGIAAKRIQQASIAARKVEGLKLSKLIDAYRESKRGRLYQVELAPEPDEYLDWDKPLSEQGEKIKAALDGVEFKYKINDSTKGEDIYLNIALDDSRGFENTGYKAASEYLHSIGIRGIKYLDGSSRPSIWKYDVDVFGSSGSLLKQHRVRTKAEADDIVADAEASGRTAKVKQIQQPDDQNHNYVIFDDADVKITAKESRRASNDLDFTQPQGSEPLRKTSFGYANDTHNLFHISTFKGNDGDVSTFDVYDTNTGEQLGFVSLGLRDGQITTLVAIEAEQKNVGFGEQLLRSLVARNPDGIYIINMLPEAVPFWQKMGVSLDEHFEGVWKHGNGVLTEEAIHAARNSERGIAAEDPGGRQKESRGNAESESGRQADNPVSSKGVADKTAPANAGVSVSAPTESVRRIQSVVERFKSQFKGATALDIRVVSTTFEIPTRFRPSPFAEGVFHDDEGIIYLVTMNLRDQNGNLSERRAWQVLLHESVGHYGLARMLGNKFASLLKAVKQATLAGRKVSETQSNPLQPGDKDYTTWEAVKLRYPKASDAEVAQEVLARMSETDPGSSIVGYAVATVRQWVRDVARAMGVNVVVSTSELRDLVAKASGYMRRGDNLAEERVPSGLVAASQKVGAGETAFNLVDVTSAAFKKLSRLLGSASIPGGVEPNLYQAVVDGLKGNAEAIANLLESRPFLSHGYRGLNIPAKRMVVKHVLGVSQNDEVVRRVIASVPVDMMNLLVGKELSAKSLLRDEAMLKDVLAVDGKPLVSLGVNVSDAVGTLMREVARAATEVASGLTDRALENNSAYTAGLGDSVLGRHSEPRNLSGFANYKAVDTTSASFLKWFGDSKVVDAGGNPLRVYHGTDADLTEFKRVDSRTGHPSAQLGVFFTASAKVADRFNRVKTDLPFSDIGKLDFAEGANQLPVYLSIKNPAVLSAKEFRDLMVDLGSPPDKVYGWMRTPEGWAALRDHFINAEGRDGVKILAERNVYSGSGLEEYAADQYVAFNPTQIKSAISNTGDFDSTNPSILESRAASPQGPIWSAPEMSRTDNIIYTMQDKNIDLKRVQQAIKEVVGEIRDDIDTYLQEELFHGRAAKITEEFLDKEVNPLISLMRASNVSMDELETFLWARHAKERNAQIAKINDEMPDGGSGLTNKQADDLMAGKDVKIGDKTIAGVKPARKKLLSDLAGRVDAITKGNRALLERYSLESADTLNAWDGAYKHYVPLHREDAESHLAGMGTGQGYSVKGSSSKRATGSSRPVENILANLALQRERIITRGEKNRVAQSLYGLAKEMPNADLWEVDVKPTMRTTAMIGGREQVVDAIDPAFRSKPNVVFARFNGEDRFVVFNEHNERALRMAEALKNLDADDISHLLGEVSRWTRYFASINTQYNPIFGVTNLVRDVQTGLLNLKSTPIEGKQKELMGNLTHALPAVFKALRADRKGQSASGSWAQLWEEFQEVGGQTGYRDMFRNSQERAEALQSALDPTWWQKTWWGKAATVGGVLAVPEQAFLDKVGKPLMELLSDYNTMMENGIRLAAYKVALDTGMTQARAASLAKNLTVNFNRKGQAARQVGAMYAFFNASIQGTARMAETLNHGAKPGELLGKAGKQIIYGGLMLGALQAMLLLAAGFDDEEPPEFVRDRNIIIPTGNGKYISIPMPLGFHVLPAISRISIEFTAGGFKKPGEHLVHIMDVLLDSFNPIGNAGLSMQTVAPTVLDPIAALTENKDWSGRQIARQDFSKLNPTPGYTRAKDTASSLSRGLAYALNYLSGGGEYGIGIVSPTPDQIDYLLGQLTGGVGRELGKVVTTAEALTTGEDLPPHKIPLVGRFYGNTAGQSSEASKFYGTLEKLAEHRGTLDRMKDAHDTEAYREYAKEHPEIRFYDRANKVQRELSSLRKLKRTMIERDADRAKIRQIEDRMKTLMARFNQAVSEQEGNHR